MPLSMLDCTLGTVVDHRYKRNKDGREEIRPQIRRGIIVKVDGEVGSTGWVSALWVKFSKDSAPENILACELVRFLPASSRVAKEAYRRIMGIPKLLGVVKQSTRNAPPRIVDDLQLTPTKRGGPVEQEDPGIAGMEDLKDEDV